MESASPWDTIVVCPGVYAESSTPVNSALNPVAPGAQNGLTINKPLKIVGAGAGLVTIKPAGPGSLAGTEAFLRDGGGNVVTVSGSRWLDRIRRGVRRHQRCHDRIERGPGGSRGRVLQRIRSDLRHRDRTDRQSRFRRLGVVETNSMEGAGSGTADDR